VLFEFLYGRAATEIAESGKKPFVALNLRGEAGHYRNNFRVHQRSKIVHPPVEPRLVDLTHRRGGAFVFGFVHQTNLPSSAALGKALPRSGVYS